MKGLNYLIYIAFGVLLIVGGVFLSIGYNFHIKNKTIKSIKLITNYEINEIWWTRYKSQPHGVLNLTRIKEITDKTILLEFIDEDDFSRVIFDTRYDRHNMGVEFVEKIPVMTMGDAYSEVRYGFSSDEEDTAYKDGVYKYTIKWDSSFEDELSSMKEILQEYINTQNKYNIWLQEYLEEQIVNILEGRYDERDMVFK